VSALPSRASGATETATVESTGRAPRIEVENGIYHVVARGNERKAILRDATDREWFLAILEERHGRVGYLSQGRYSARLVQADEHLLAAVRYIITNPVRAGLCTRLDERPWSSHRAAPAERPPAFLALERLLLVLRRESAAGASPLPRALGG